MANFLQIGVVFVTILGVGLLVTSVATNYWRTYSILLKVNEGLFRRCVEYSQSTSCGKLFNDYGDLPAKFAGVIAMMILAIIFEGLSIIVKLADLVIEKKMNGVVAVLNAFAVVAGAAGLSVYTKYYLGDYYDAGWSYIIGWVGVGLLAVALVMLIVLIGRR